MQLVWRDGPDDDDMQRLSDATHSRALVAFLRTPFGYEGLLGLKEPPCSVSHPLLSELSQHPLGTHAELVREAVLCGLAGEMPGEGGRRQGWQRWDDGEVLPEGQAAAGATSVPPERAELGRLLCVA